MCRPISFLHLTNSNKEQPSIWGRGCLFRADERACKKKITSPLPPAAFVLCGWMYEDALSVEPPADDEVPAQPNCAVCSSSPLVTSPKAASRGANRRRAVGLSRRKRCVSFLTLSGNKSKRTCDVQMRSRRQMRGPAFICYDGMWRRLPAFDGATRERTAARSLSVC